MPVVPKATMAPIASGAAVLVIVRNALTEPVSVRAQAWTPITAAFLDTHVADVDAGGATAFVASLANEVRVDLPYAEASPKPPFRLALVNGELRLQPSAGLEQKQTPLPPGLPFNHCLTVSLQAVVDLPAAPALQSFEELVAQHPHCQSIRAAVVAAGSTLPPQRTMLVPRILSPELATLPPEDLLARLTTATAIFCGPQRRGADLMLDGSLLTVVAEAGQVKFVVAAKGELPSLELKGDVVPLRCTERFQLLYLVG